MQYDLLKIVQILKLTGVELFIIYDDNNEVVYPVDRKDVNLCRSILLNSNAPLNSYYDDNSQKYYGINTSFVRIPGTDGKKYKIIKIDDKTKDVVLFNTMKSQLRSEYLIDSITGIPLRKETDRLAIDYISNAAYKMQDFAIIWADIDNFKGLNDNFGHPFGDTILEYVANTFTGNVRIKDNKKYCIREKDIVGRMGGDEFMIILKNISYENACAKIEKIKRDISSFGKNDDMDYKLSCSFGMIYVPKSELQSVTNPKEYFSFLCSKSDLMLYDSKRNGKDTVTSYKLSLNKK